MRNAFFDQGTPRILAHRGLALEAPENTVAAFVHAMAAGATHVETDVHASRDGAAVISHDPDLARSVGRDDLIADLTMRDLGRIDLGGAQTFGELTEVLDGLPDVCFNIDVKNDRAVAPTVRAVQRTRAEDRVLVTSFSESRRARLAGALPRAATSASVQRVMPALLAGSLGSAASIRRTLAGIDAVQIPERKGPLPLLSRRMLRAMHAAGVEVHVWTVNEATDMERLLVRGVDGIVTDRTDLAVAVVARLRRA